MKEHASSGSVDDQGHTIRQQGLRWLQQAADSGVSPAAAEHLGLLLLRGDGVVAKDTEKAVSYLEKAAASGMAAAQMKLGALHHEGPPRMATGKNEETAVSLIRRAAENGSVTAGDAAATLCKGGQQAWCFH